MRLNRSQVMLLLGFGLLVVQVAAATWLADQQQRSVALVHRSLVIENRLSRILSDLQDAETGQRGYLLTGDPRYLRPYDVAIGRTGGDIDGLASLYSVNPVQREAVARLRDLTQQRATLLARLIELYREGDIRSATAKASLDRGKAVMDGLRVQVAAMQDREARLLAQREETSQAQARMVQLGLALDGLVILALAAYVLAHSRRQLAEAVTARDELWDANARLREEARTRESAEAQLRQVQKMESIGQLTGGIAHDFNNMLAIVIGSLDMAKRRLDRDRAKAEVCIDNAMEGARRAALLTARLLAFSRQQPLEPRPLDINKLVGAMSELLRRTIGENVQIETVLAGGLWPTFVDANQLENAILNLAVNARDAMPDGGRLTIETGNAHLDEAYASANAEVAAGQYVLVCITDTGVGMPAELIERVFDPFFTTKGIGKGTGLGLSQVHGFVKQSGGHVKIYSEPGHGTTAKIYLPRHFGGLNAEPEPTADHVGAPMAQPEEIILVVEDDEKVRHVSVEALRELGYTLVQAADANQALAVLALQPRIDLLFTDVIMPDMNGRRLADQARQSRPELKVLYTTGYTRNAVVHNGVLDPGVAFIPKPFTIHQLALKVRQVLDGVGFN